VIKQGEQGNKFYIILEGQLVAEKTETVHELPRVVYKYKEGEYFGELALMHDVCRQASVKALTPVRVAFLDRESFKRIFGTMEDILKRNEEKYGLTSELICA
jgi:cAMP-dependent protein kinase regulator